MTPPATTTDLISAKLEQFLRRRRVRRVYFAEDSVPPPPLAYVTHFPRLYLPLSGHHPLHLAQNGSATIIRPGCGQAVFVAENAWDKPEWSSDLEVFTFLFGAKHIGISLAKHGGSTPVSAVKTNVHGAYDGVTHNILAALNACAQQRSTGSTDRLLVESLLHSCLRLLRLPAAHPQRKAVKTYDSICLYVQQNFQSPLSREMVAQHFSLAPNHVSRLFHCEGQMRFNDYLNWVRMSRARFILRHYKLTLKEVAANCGYSDVAYFCRVFKATNNQTPTQYRAAI